MFQLAGRQN